MNILKMFYVKNEMIKIKLAITFGRRIFIKFVMSHGYEISI